MGKSLLTVNCLLVLSINVMLTKMGVCVDKGLIEKKNPTKKMKHRNIILRGFSIGTYVELLMDE